MSDKSATKIITGTENIELYRMRVMLGRMELELKGVKFKVNTFAAVRNEFGLKGRREKVYADFRAICVEKGVVNE